MDEIILQRQYGNEFHTLYVYEDGRIICECLYNLFDKNKNTCSNCKHARDLLDAITHDKVGLFYYDVSTK